MRIENWESNLYFEFDGRKGPPVFGMGGYTSSARSLYQVGRQLNERLGVPVELHSLPRHNQFHQQFRASRGWHFLTEGEDTFLRAWDKWRQPMIVLGYSTGALPLIRCAVLHPDKVRGIILASPAFGFRTPKEKALAATTLVTHYVLPTALGLFAGWQLARKKSILKGGVMAAAAAITPLAIGNLFFERPALPYEEDGHPVQHPHHTRINMVSAATILPVQLAISRALPQVKQPVLIVYSKADRAISATEIERAAKKLPNCKLEELPDAGHRVLSGSATEQFLNFSEMFISGLRY